MVLDRSCYVLYADVIRLEVWVLRNHTDSLNEYLLTVHCGTILSICETLLNILKKIVELILWWNRLPLLKEAKNYNVI